MIHLGRPISYICSRIFLHNPPGDENALVQHPLAPEALKEEEKRLAEAEPEVNQWVLIVMLLISIAIMAATAEWVCLSVHAFRMADDTDPRNS